MARVTADEARFLRVSTKRGTRFSADKQSVNLVFTLTFHDLGWEILRGVKEKNQKVKRVKNTERMLTASV